jgi:hypothetical protein
MQFQAPEPRQFAPLGVRRYAVYYQQHHGTHAMIRAVTAAEKPGIMAGLAVYLSLVD